MRCSWLGDHQPDDDNNGCERREAKGKPSAEQQDSKVAAGMNCSVLLALRDRSRIGNILGGIALVAVLNYIAPEIGSSA
jgi:hypothetical protein